VGFELNAFVTEKCVSARDKQFDVGGADEPGIIDVVSQPLADAVRIYVKGRIVGRWLLRSAV
jgi:hypothetical protein